jgi:hypothetical protein
MTGCSTYSSPNHETPSGVKEGGILPYIYINNGKRGPSRM